eukprot:CAMPEP_0180272172 /NCGR_PEP_ID=MMETSP0988-20121125/4104_1 /TAXON_ID=697907 /ORGANISM="non described non described, Strain CCMP2293" /LENGTH=143 /DNA_ID=CAMNT_0022243227 /DNA_START=51 /DNA_END=478 /DNA_ORIENTATION=+
MAAVDGAMGLPYAGDAGEKLIGKHVRPQMGQLVKISQQGLLRRKEAGRSDPSRGGVGAVVRVNANWSCDVKWQLTHQVREGYSTGGVGVGGKTRAFHLALIDPSTILEAEQDEEPFRPLNLETQRAKFALPMDPLPHGAHQYG